MLLADGPRQRSSCCRWDSCAGIFVGHPRYCLLVAESEREGDRPTVPLFSALLAGPPTSLLRTIHLLSISATIHLFMSTSSCPRSFPASFVSAEPEHLHAAGESKPLWVSAVAAPRASHGATDQRARVRPDRGYRRPYPMEKRKGKKKLCARYGVGG